MATSVAMRGRARARGGGAWEQAREERAGGDAGGGGVGGADRRRRPEEMRPGSKAPVGEKWRNGEEKEMRKRRNGEGTRKASTKRKSPSENHLEK